MRALCLVFDEFTVAAWVETAHLSFSLLYGHTFVKLGVGEDLGSCGHLASSNKRFGIQAGKQENVLTQAEVRLETNGNLEAWSPQSSISCSPILAMAAVSLLCVSPVEFSANLGLSEPFRGGGRLYDNLGCARRASGLKHGCKPERKNTRLSSDQRRSRGTFSVLSSLVVNPAGEAVITSEKKVYEVILKQAALVKEQMRSKTAAEVKPGSVTPGMQSLLEKAYDLCGEICKEYAKTFYLGTLLMTPERRRAIWAIYVWCRRTDELVDGPNASHITPSALDRWESRLEDVFAGRPYDMFDAALSDTVLKFPIDVQPFKDMIEGMRLDLVKSRYKNFDELYLYCYYVAGTVGLMSVPVMGIAPESCATAESVYSAALALGIGNQLTNILRDVGEDARRGRIYLPRDELAQAGLSDEDVFKGAVTDRWRSFMRSQIKRARMFFHEAERGVTDLDKASRWPVWASLLLYGRILDEIEANDYNNFTKRAYVGKAKKLMTLPIAYGKSLITPSSRKQSGHVNS